MRGHKDMSQIKAVISGVGLWTPEHIVTNDELVAPSYEIRAEAFCAETKPILELESSCLSLARLRT